jgi:holliday junction DNA helicase RuvA
VADDRATLAAGPFEFEVLVPDFVRRRLQPQVGDTISLHTIEYIEGGPASGRMIPRLVGFLSPVEREFFEMFCSVDGLGVKKALRAMVRPVRDIAIVIEQQDAKALATLPGIGAATADRVIAKLRRKMSRFALLVSDDVSEPEVRRDVVQDTFDALLALGHSESESRKLIDAVLAGKQKFPDVESLLRAIFQYTVESKSR